MTQDKDGMLESAEACMAFFKSVPELYAHFKEVYERHGHGEELWPLAGDEEDLSEILPKGQAVWPWDINPRAIEYRLLYRQIMNDFGENHPELRHEIEEAERIIARNTKPVSLHTNSHVNAQVEVETDIQSNTTFKIGDVLITLSDLFRNVGKDRAPAAILVSAKETGRLHDAVRIMAKKRDLPVIFADADLAIDEISGAPAGRSETAGDSLFRRIDEIGKGVLVIDCAENIRTGTGRVLEYVLEGKPLMVPGVNHPIDFTKWTIVMRSEDETAVSPALKDRTGALLRLDGLMPQL